MQVVTSYLSLTRAAASTEPVPELAVPTAFGSILEELESETDAMAGQESVDRILARLKSVEAFWTGRKVSLS